MFWFYFCVSFLGQFMWNPDTVIYFLQQDVWPFTLLIILYTFWKQAVTLLSNKVGKLARGKIFMLWKFLFCFYSRCTCSFIYYALSLNARSLSGNVFINFFLLSAVEIPANIAAFLCLRAKILGRRRTHILAYLLAGLACLISVPLIVYYGEIFIPTWYLSNHFLKFFEFINSFYEVSSNLKQL